MISPLSALDLQRIKAILQENAAIDECAILNRPTTNDELHLLAYVVPGEATDLEQMHRKVSQQLAETIGLLPDSLDASIIFLSSLPLTLSGEVDEEALAGFSVDDDGVLAQWETYLQHSPVVEQAVVVRQEYTEPLSSLYLMESLPARRRTVLQQETIQPSSARPAIAYGGARHEDIEVPATLPDALLRSAHQQEEKGIVYLQSDGTEIKQSYASLCEEAGRILAGLRKQGLQPGDIVMLQVEENQDYLPTFWACVLGGLIAAPVSIAPSYTQPTITIAKLQKAWELCGHPLIVASASLAPALQALAPTLGMNDLRLETVETLRAQPSDAHERSWHESQPDDVFLLLFTSGSTGTPKGVMLTHRNVLSLAAGYTQLEGLTSQEITFNWMPLDHIGGLVTFHLRDIYLGCQQVHARPATVLQDPLMWLNCLDRYRATCTWAPNFAFSLINERAEIIVQRQWNLSSLHYILDAGEAIVPKTARRFLELLAPHGLASNAIHPSWGMSETSSGVTFSSRFSLETTTDEDRFVDVGALIPEVWVRVVDERQQLVAEGKSGRIQVKGPTVTPGYFNHPEFNQEVFTADGWFETGDVGMLREGRLTITGRSKHIIIVNGLNYYSHEIEGVVEEVAGVAATYTGACAVRDAENNTDALAIFYHSLFTNMQQILEQREEIFRRVVSAVGISPTYLVPLEKEAIPKTETGKVQRTKLKQQFEEGMFDSALRRLALAPVHQLIQLTAYLKLKQIEEAFDALSAYAANAGITDRFGQSVPCMLVQVETFPLTSTGEIDREALRRQEQLASANGRSVPEILSPVEQQLISLWQEIFKQTEVHKQDHFFLLGGHSLTLMQLLARIRETFHVKLTIQDIFDYPTVAALAQRIEAAPRRDLVGQPSPILPVSRTAEYGRDVEEISQIRQRQENLPLSFAQQQQWVLNQLDPSSPRYNVPGIVHLQGTLDIVALERSVQEIIRRHEALRTTFVLVDGEPIQIIMSSLIVPIPVRDLQHLPENERLAEARRLATAEGRSPFNLRQGPLIRVLLFVLKPDEYVFALNMHHIVSDGWSVGIFLQELFALYAAFSRGIAPQLPELPIQYADYALWQRGWMQDERLQPLLAYWKQKLEGAPPAVVLPTDRPRPMANGVRGASVSLFLSQSLSEALQALSRQQEVTLFMTMLTVLNILLFQWTGQSDLVVGTVIANRNQKDTEKLIGCFMNFLALRSQISGQMTGLELLARVKETVIEAHMHQDYPFEKLVTALNPIRKANHYPLYNIAFLLQNFPFSPHVVQNIISPVTGDNALQFSLLPVELQVALLDLRLIAEETPKGIYLECEYDTELFDTETIEQFLASYTRIVETFVQTPAVPLSSLNITPQLQEQARTAKAREHQETIAITATFTAEPLEESLAFWMQELEWSATIAFAPYNQVFQQLLDPNSQLAQNQRGINVVLLRFEDWLRFDTTLETVAQAREKIARNIDELVQALQTATRYIATPFLVAVCPASPKVEADATFREFLVRMEDQLATDLAEMRNVFPINSTELKTVYPVADAYDPYADEMGHIPYSTEFFAALGTHIVRKIAALRRTPSKVIVLDCDQTLWQGICGEDGAQGVIIDPPRRALQEFLVAQQEAGMLLCLCSKNNEQDVFEVFACHPEMPLKREHLVAWRINWEPKSQNLRALAEELQLSLDSFIFIDDNPLERAEVQSVCPEVLIFPFPQEPDHLPQLLQHFWVFDHLRITAEDRKRTELYQHQLQRQVFQQASTTLEDFLAALQLQVHIAQMEDAQLDRVAQLTQRTNQFNCSTIRRTESELQRFYLESNGECLIVNVSDRFGDYGLVGVILFTENPTAIEVDTFLLSCRTLGRGVEHQMLAKLGRIAHERQRDHVHVSLVPTPRNKPAREFLESIEGACKKPLGEGWVFEFPVAVLIELTYKPLPVNQSASDTIAGNESAPLSSNAHSTVQYKENGTRLLRIATELSTPEQVLHAITTKHRQLSRKRGTKTAPRTETERHLVDIWAEIFKLEQIGIHENFFALGGDSILSIQIVARANRAGIRIEPRHIFEYQTIAELAQEITTEDQPPPPNGSTLLDIPLTRFASGQIRKDLPLSFAQQQQWVLNQLDPYSPRYNMFGAIHLRGELDIVALERSVQEIIKRHEVLRTTFVSVDGEPIQIIAPSLIIPIPINDLRYLPADERLAEARRLATVDGLRPFDLTQGPLIRALLLVLGPDEYVFTQSMHHIVSDGWSIGILLQELFTLYPAFSCGTAPQLPELPLQYADYALWQREWMHDERLKPLQAYWVQKLEGAPPAIALPASRPRPTVSSSLGASISVLLSQPLSEALRVLSRQQEASLFMAMLTALNILLFQWTGQPDLVVGTVVANRSKEDTEKLIGCFLNFLALRSQISEQMTGLEFLGEVKETVIEAYMHQDYPFEKLVAALNPIRKANHYPLYNVAFLLQNFPFSPHVLHDILSPSTGSSTLQFSFLPLERQAALLDLRLIAEETPKGILLECEYDTDLFDAETIEQLLASYIHIVETFVQTPAVPISSFNITPQLEAQAKTARAWQHTESSTSKQRRHAMAVRQRRPLPDERQRIAPRTETERCLVEIWKEVFKMEEIGIHENFFALGGDSILSIRVISKARRAGIHITPQQLIASQTIAELSEIVMAASPLQVEQGLITGVVPFIPIQNAFFFGRLGQNDRNHWNIARLIEVSPQALNSALWMRAVQYLLLYHDPLRTRFVQNESGLQQFIAPPDSRVPFVNIDLSVLSGEEQRTAIESISANLQLSLNLSEGPLLRVALFDLGRDRPGRLLLIVHHVVVDGFSFAILLEDLHIAYEQLSRGEKIYLPPKTTPHKQWAEQLVAHAQSERFHRELASFLSLPWTKAVPLPLDYPAGRGTNTLATLRQVKARLSVEETAILLQKVQAGADLQLIEVLIAALAYTLSRWVGGHPLPIDIVHHGRETCFDNMDLTRTVGLCIYNINTLFDLENAETPQNALRAVKEQFRRINHVVLGCAGDRTFVADECTAEPWATIAEKTKDIPRCEVCFNYYGQVDEGGMLSTQFRPAPESFGVTESRQNLDFYTFYCRGIIDDTQQFMFMWEYSEKLYRRTTVEHLVETFMETLKSLIHYGL